MNLITKGRYGLQEWVQIGPERWAEANYAREKGLKRYIPEPGEKAAFAPTRPTQPARTTAPPKAAAHRPSRPTPAKSAVPAAPVFSPTPIVHMRRDEMKAERDRLEDWLVLVADKTLSAAEREVYDRIKYRADELYALEAMAR